MIKNDVFVVGIGLGGERVGYEFQQRNYPTYLINGSGQDNKTLPEAKDVLVLEGYDELYPLSRTYLNFSTQFFGQPFSVFPWK